MELKHKIGEAIPVLIAAMFLLTQVGMLVHIAWKHRLAPAPDYNEYIRPVDEDYVRAVHAAMQPDNSYVSHSLVSVNRNQPLTVVTWTGSDKLLDFQAKTAPKDIWVTVVPRLKTFCQDYVTTYGADAEQLKLRLQQRLGLPPTSNYGWFVELKLSARDITKLFRPCGDPSTGTNTCEPGSPPKPYEIEKRLKASNLGNRKNVEQFWLLANYYQAFASRDQYPWTSLGYTFDWAPTVDASDDFVRWGESEFVIPKDTPIQFISQAETVTYCAPH